MKNNAMSVLGIQLDLKAHMLSFEGLCRAAKEAAGLGYNTVLLEYQDKFPFEGELSRIAAPDALTREEIAAFNAVCEEAGLEVIPLIQCMGHLHYVLRYEEFAHLAEVFPGKDHSALCPSHPGSMELFEKMAQQVLEMHPGCRKVHIGGDEVHLFEGCPRCGDKPKHQLLAEQYSKAVGFIRNKGILPIMWADTALAHPETLASLRGKVVLMDWNYHCEGAPDETPLVWGCDAAHPENWSDMHKEMILPYVWDEEGKTRPFHYLQFLKDQGFEVLVAPAAKCGGDPAFVPHHRHLPNCLTAVRAAAKAGIEGVLVSSWSVRRVPWLLTEKAVIAAAMAAKDPAVTDEEIALCFAERHFGVKDASLAEIPEILSRAAAEAAKVCDLFTIGHHFPGEDVGMVDTYELRKAHCKQTWVGNGAIAPAYGKLAEAAKKAQALLDKACPQTDGQRERTAFWQWSIDTAALLAEYAPLLAEETIPSETAKRFIGKFEELGEKGEKLMEHWYTAWSTRTDTLCRIGIHTDYLKQFI
ncbi:MAG: family 20 glycosylhydrolase [Oscillospiraceae bacterium]|nr:family 20 glycosylhydrolase [Oscillospiraceae bacterium]